MFSSMEMNMGIHTYVFTPNSFPSLQLVCCYIKIADSIKIQLLMYTWCTTNVNVTGPAKINHMSTNYTEF